MNKQAREEILKRLDEAFPALPISMDFDVHPLDGWTTYEDRDAFARNVAHKTWSELPDDLVKAHPDVLFHLPGATFRAVLPAYLRFIASDDVYNEVPFSVANMLTRTDDGIFEQRVSPLAPAQLRIVARIVELSLTREPMEDVMQQAYDSYWRDYLDNHEDKK